VAQALTDILAKDFAEDPEVNAFLIAQAEVGEIDCVILFLSVLLLGVVLSKEYFYFFYRVWSNQKVGEGSF
jgi:hypothetical protein